MPVIQKEAFYAGYSYEEYFDFVRSQIERPSTAVYCQYRNYIEQNFARMKRLSRRVPSNLFLAERIAAQRQRMNVLILSEPWCGDAAQSIPVVYNALKKNPNFVTRVFLRDECGPLMDQFLTGESRSIPIVAFLDEQMELLFRWGPRPVQVQALFRSWNQNEHLHNEDILYRLHHWYAADRGNSVEKELLEVMNGKPAI